MKDRDNLRPLFSIFVPIYNAEQYLSECIESVLAQSISSWEMILVDDGSTDNSGNICDEYLKRDNRIKVIHKKNGGEFSSRYAAMQIATGIYATGLDADDKYVNNYLETIAMEIGRSDYDCIKWSFTFFEEQSGISKLPPDSIGEYRGQEYLRFIVKTTLHSFCSQAIKLEILKQVDFSDIPRVRMSEDYIMVIPALCYVKSAKVLDYYGYLYRIHSDSSSNAVSFSKIYDLCEVSKYGLKVMRDTGVLNEELEAGERLSFLKCAWPRIENALKNNAISREQIESIRKHESYVNSAMMESVREFGMREFLKMKLFRYGYDNLLRKVL